MFVCEMCVSCHDLFVVIHNLPYPREVNAERRAYFAVAHATFAHGDNLCAELRFIGVASVALG